MRSSMYRAGEILLLVGAILAAFGALMMAMLAGVMGFIADLPFIIVLYGALALASVAGAVVGFIAYGKARAGDARGAFVLGLVASLLPPVQVIVLVGAILVKVSPEGEAAAAATAAHRSSQTQG